MRRVWLIGLSVVLVLCCLLCGCEADAVVYDWDACGGYGTAAIGIGENDFDSTFGGDKWTADWDANDDYPEVYFVNKQYPDVSLVLYPVDYDGETISNFSNIKHFGFSGYDIVLADAGVDAPEMTWNGVSFGAGFDDIKAAYGRCRNVERLDGHKRYTYIPGGYDDGYDSCRLTFDVYADGGLRAVEFRSF